MSSNAKTSPDFRVSAPLRREGRDQTFWAPVGVAFVNPPKNGAAPTITVRLDALPIGGELVLFPDDAKNGRERE